MQSKLNRRGVLAGFAALTVSTGFPAYALDEAGARKLVDTVVAEINKVIEAGKSESATIRDFEKIFSRYADVPTMARYALGADGRSASAGELRAFTDAFQGYLARKYGKQFRDFIGGRIEFESVREIKAGYEIRSTAFLRGQDPVSVSFLVSDRSGSDRLFNIFVEGVNLLLTERTEIGAMLDNRRGDIGQLTKDLRSAG
ncbi:phospholipid-binding protein MlaC [uncultured Roseobacter sp.]|uniref:MlaC/ttg2D family ABC transporter substrate-binding protein n=1 Tax=uncultured Roseobacter sp. TaxID=114847 RepID=UPI00262812F1|nr:ABC transporter substrate-binding protein [uncultured Roseobacter sp.]